jgi:hypothetical protein
MGIEFHKKTVRLVDIVEVEAAEALLEWLQKTPRGTVDLTCCTHLHAANLQVLMAAARPIGKWPADPGLRSWLQSALTST